MDEEKMVASLEEIVVPIEDEEQQPLSPEEEKALWQQTTAESIRERGRAEQYLTLCELCESSGKSKEEVLALLDEMTGQEAYGDICVYQGAKDAYYYTYPLLAHNYIKNLVLAREDDLSRTIAEVVRYESKTYPRATRIDTFSKFPYHYTVAQTQEMAEKMMKLPEYADLHLFESSQGNVYLFSDKYLLEVRAKAMVEIQEDVRNWM